MATRQAFGVSNGYAPAQGPKALPIEVDFTGSASQTFNLLQEETQGQIQNIQSVFVDNSDNANPLTILFAITQQRIVVPAGAQGIWPVICAEQVQFTVSTNAGDGLQVMLILLNVPMPLTQWGPISATVNVTTASGNFTNRSGNIAVGGTAQDAMAANPVRKRFIITNPSTEIESLFIGFGQNATLDNNSLEIMPGGSFDSNFGPVELARISVNAATGGHTYFAQEM